MSYLGGAQVDSRRWWVVFVAVFLFSTAPAYGQSYAPGGAQYPSPAPGRHFLDTPVAQCVIAVPVGQNAVMLTPCPTPTVTPPVAPPPVAQPKEEGMPPVVINIYPGSATDPPQVETLPAPPAKPAPPRATPQGKVQPKKPCTC